MNDPGVLRACPERKTHRAAVEEETVDLGTGDVGSPAVEVQILVGVLAERDGAIGHRPGEDLERRRQELGEPGEGRRIRALHAQGETAVVEVPGPGLIRFVPVQRILLPCRESGEFPPTAALPVGPPAHCSAVAEL